MSVIIVIFIIYVVIIIINIIVIIIITIIIIIILINHMPLAVVHVFLFLNTEALSFLDSLSFARHADVMKKIIQTVADGGGGELGVHMYPTLVAVLW